MKKLLFVIAIPLVLKGNAQNYLISFAGTGASATVNSVIVENLTVGTTIILNGSDILRLTETTGVNPTENKQSAELKIFPNPMTGNSTVRVYPPVAGDAIITIYEITGKPVARIHSYLENYPQEFSLSGIKSGFYLISVKGNNYQYSGRLLCNDKAGGNTSIVKISNNQAVAEKISKTDNKGTQTTIDMEYSTGERLKFTGVSGNFSTVITDIPTQDKTISFNLIACSDGDNNNYPVVGIGTQLWIAKNLKTTKYNNGTSIPIVRDNTAWSNLTTGAYCTYASIDETEYKNIYGALYNWYTVAAGNLCPTGWHIPTDDEWTTLSTYLGGENVAGGKLKETGTYQWDPPNTGATNETGFTALPAGLRLDIGGFGGLRTDCILWSSTEFITKGMAIDRILAWTSNRFNWNWNSKMAGLSVRCLKD